MTGATVRSATYADLPAVVDLYRHYVEETTYTWVLEPLTLQDWTDKFDDFAAAGLPFVVLESAPGVIEGFAYLGVYRAKGGWSGTVEDTIYLRPESGGRGWGTQLLNGLLEAGRQTGQVRQVIAMICHEAESSVWLHRKCGFAEVGRLTGVGHKHGRDLDCIVMQRPLDSSVSDSW